ncbi:MAG TPA: Gfo/Idh/MocA family oxidoreductase [Tepidisphaeraceae bacterium]|jgi:predicted dehydrogenase
MSRMIRIGLIGCGQVASYGHMPTITATPGLTLHSICDIDPERLAAARDRFKVPNAFTDVEELFASGIDAAVITSPAPLHFAHVTAAARHGKPALCEKPLAMSEEEAARMISIMHASNRPLFVGFTYRFSPVAMDVHRLIREGAIGKVRSLRLAYVWDCHGKYLRRGDPQSGLNLHRQGRMEEGGPMVDCGVHQVDLARWWTGSEVVRVAGRGAWVETENYEAPDHVYLHMDHESGAHTAVEISFTYAHTARDSRCEFWYEIIGTDGMIRYNRQSRYFEITNGAGTQHLTWTEEKNFEGMYAEFEHALRTGEARNMPTAQDGMLATKIALAATKDAEAWRKTATTL